MWFQLCLTLFLGNTAKDITAVRNEQYQAVRNIKVFVKTVIYKCDHYISLVPL
jgi:hypothetical protein